MAILGKREGIETTAVTLMSAVADADREGVVLLRDTALHYHDLAHALKDAVLIQQAMSLTVACLLMGDTPPTETEKQETGAALKVATQRVREVLARFPEEKA